MLLQKILKVKNIRSCENYPPPPSPKPDSWFDRREAASSSRPAVCRPSCTEKITRGREPPDPEWPHPQVKHRQRAARVGAHPRRSDAAMPSRFQRTPAIPQCRGLFGQFCQFFEVKDHLARAWPTLSDLPIVGFRCPFHFLASPSCQRRLGSFGTAILTTTDTIGRILTRRGHDGGSGQLIGGKALRIIQSTYQTAW